jgi:hypothetical protein
MDALEPRAIRLPEPDVYVPVQRDAPVLPYKVSSVVDLRFDLDK